MVDPIDLVSHSYTFQIVDGRSITGVLIAIDDESNLLVTNAQESDNHGHFRELGLVSIKRDTIAKVYMTEAEYKDTFIDGGII